MCTVNTTNNQVPSEEYNQFLYEKVTIQTWHIYIIWHVEEIKILIFIISRQKKNYFYSGDRRGPLVLLDILSRSFPYSMGNKLHGDTITKEVKWT